MIKKFGICIFCLISVTAIAQNSVDTKKSQNVDYAISTQFYPAGFIPTINADYYLNENSSLLFRIGGNFVDRQDFSEFNDNETGNGFGASFGYRKHHPLKKGKIIVGINNDVWNLWINYKNASTDIRPEAGRTYTLVVQPWLEAGYFYPVGKKEKQIGISIGFGREINAVTIGREVAQGFIGSFTLQYVFARR